MSKQGAGGTRLRQKCFVEKTDALWIYQLKFKSGWTRSAC